MTQSTSAMLKAALGGSFPEKRVRVEGTWQRICVCGHPEAKHAESIGGTFQVPKPPRVKRYVFDGCIGQPKDRGANEFQLLGVVPDDENPEQTWHVFKYTATCPCDEFRPVLEVRDPRFRFYQRRPNTTPRSKKRDYDPARHALMVGIRATRTSVSKMKDVEDARRSGKNEEEIEAIIDRLVDLRLRTLDTWRCMMPECSTAEGVLPYYFDIEKQIDRSELRCPEHRP